MPEVDVVEKYNWWYFFLGIMILILGTVIAVLAGMVWKDSSSSNTVKNLGLAGMIVGIVVAVLGFIMIIAAFWGGNTYLETVQTVETPEGDVEYIEAPVGVYGAPLRRTASII